MRSGLILDGKFITFDDLIEDEYCACDNSNNDLNNVDEFYKNLIEEMKK